MFKRVADDFFVASQLHEPDFREAKRLGIKTVVNNRPDGEAPDQLPHERAKATAEALGLTYQFVPVVSGGIFPDHIAQFAATVDASKGPILAYCRSGTRSTHLWALQAARSRPVDEIIEAAHEAGYDVSALRPLLEEISDNHGDATPTSRRQGEDR